MGETKTVEVVPVAGSGLAAATMTWAATEHQAQYLGLDEATKTLKVYSSTPTKAQLIRPSKSLRRYRNYGLFISTVITRTLGSADWAANFSAGGPVYVAPDETTYGKILVANTGAGTQLPYIAYGQSSTTSSTISLPAALGLVTGATNVGTGTRGMLYSFSTSAYGGPAEIPLVSTLGYYLIVDPQTGVPADNAWTIAWSISEVFGT